MICQLLRNRQVNKIEYKDRIRHRQQIQCEIYNIKSKQPKLRLQTQTSIRIKHNTVISTIKLRQKRYLLQPIYHKMRSQQQLSVVNGSKQNVIDPSNQNVIQLKVIKNYCLYPFRVSEVNNYMEMTYTCLMDSRYREVVGVELVAGYRKIKVVGKGQGELGNQLQGKNQLQGDRIFGSGQGKEEKKTDWVVGLVVMVDGLEQKVKGLSRSGNKGRKQSQMKMSRSDTEQQQFNDEKPTLYVPYSIYLKLKATQQPSTQLNPSPQKNLSPSQNLHISLERFPYSLTSCLTLYPIQQQLSTLTITEVRFFGNEPAQQAQVKQLLTRMIVSPKWNAKNKGKDAREFEFLVFPQERRKRVVVDLGWLAEGLLTGFKGIGMSMSNRLVRMIRQNKVKSNIRDNNCYRNYLQFGIQVTPSINLREYTSAKPYIAKFIPGKTLIQFQSSTTSPFNPPLQPFLRTLHLSQLYSTIFSQTSYYQSLHRKLSPLITSSVTDKSKQNDTGGFLCLRTDKDVGTSEFIQIIVQEKCWNRRFIKIDCQEYATLEGFYRRLKRVSEDGDCVIFIENITWLQSLSKNQDIVQQSTKSLLQKIASHITTSFSPTLLNPTVIVHFTSAIPEQLPYMYTRVNQLLTNEQKHQIFSMVVKYYDVPQQVNQTLQAMLGNSCGWQKVARFLKGLKQTKQLTSICIDESKLIKTIQQHFALQKVQNILSVSWDDIGGLQTAKQQIIQTVLLPTKHPEIFDQWIRPRTGLLFYGPPGTGKTLLGKCIAKQCKMGFISVKGPELLNMYVGESEKNVRQIFQRAKESKPCIVFMDQLDALVPKRGNSSDGNAVMDRIVAELLMQIDMASDNQVFVIGATNRPDLLDPSILRAGRFDKQIYLGISKKKEDRVKILKAQTRNSRLQENFNFELIVDNVPENFTGADFYGLTSKAMMRAVQRSIKSFQSGLDPDPEVLITEQDFLDIAYTVKPSVTQQQLKHYQSLKQKFS